MTKLLAPLAVLLPSLSLAASLPAFEPALQGVRSAVLDAKARHAEVRAQATAAEITRAAHEVRNLEWAASRLRWDVQGIARRARGFVVRPGPDGRPRTNDPFLSSDVRRLVWNLRDHRMRSEAAEREVSRLERSAAPDASLVGPARDLAQAARSLESSAQWLASEGRWARSDLSSAGFTFEAWDVDRETRDAEDAARDIESSARRLQDRVQPPQAP